MSHELIANSRTGKYELMTRGAAWHGLGQVVENAQTWEETVKLAGLDWTVSKEQHKNARTGDLINSFGIYRDDTNAWLGEVGNDYTPIQNVAQFRFVDDLLDRESGAHYECAGAIAGGKRVFCLANLSEAFDVVDGDRHENYLLFTNSHDGSSAARVFLTSVRVVCANTLRAALGESYARDRKARKNGVASDILKIRHTKSADTKMAAAKNVITEARVGVAMLKEKLQLLAGRQMTKASYVSIVDRLFPVSKDENGVEKAGAATTRRDNVLAEILKLYEENDGNKFPEIRGTGYNLLNAMTEYTDHYRPVVQTDARAGQTVEQIRANTALFKSGAEFKETALDVILAETVNNPGVNRKTQYAMPSNGNGAAVLDAILSKN